MIPLYPFSAVVHQPDLHLALALLAVAPEIGGVLIRGDRGAAKSTAARGLAALLPPRPDGTPAPFVNLPLGATEDRVVGTLDLEAALRGELRLQPGLLAAADGGVLYIDEVNLLADHLVDVLLDVAAMGVNRVQRDGLSAEHPARLALVGSMNPEEGTLRPQFLDRFGLCVDVQAPRDPQARAEIVRRRVAFEADPCAFVERWQPEEAAWAARLAAARERLPGVTVPEALLSRIAVLSAEAGVRSLRADLVLYRAARAQAALEGRSEVQTADLERVAPLVLSHRRDPRLPPPPPPPAQRPPAPEESQHHGSGPQETPEDVLAPAPQAAPLLLPSVPAAGALPGEGRPGRVLSSVPDPHPSTLAVPATLRAALTRRGSGPLTLTREDFHAPLREEVAGRRVLFVADASGSMGTRERMGAVKGAMLDVLREQGRRDRVALLTFRGVGATLVLDFTTDAAAAEAAITAAPTGGRTPLAHALRLAADVLAGEPKAQLVLFTDGRANVPLTPGGDAWAEALQMARALRGVPALVVDTETGHVRLKRAARLAQALGAEVATLGGPL
ncbi:VWA domain-containing protein [Deinococcus sp. YIM 77859]|uniref:VWA domain-containing protein n=1 Tax=Deinococcus sp. YIM 77859 TaxID=1540221 RepID=UPI000550149C|nr:VWA domain-containing protein [Deinococcus sp. YIM 77859]